MKIQIKKNTAKEDVLRLTHACKCEACTVGCRHGSGVFADEEIRKLAEHLRISEDALKKEFLEEVEKFNTKKFRPRILRKDKQYGKCVFFDEKLGCKIHEVKPLECKVAMGCKEYGEELILWFVLNHFVNGNDPKSIREYASYLKAGGKTIEGGKLEEIIPDKEKLKKILKYGDMKESIQQQGN